jgi:pimeloyl-ACP methyl ester carboxylesterase
VTTTPDWAPVRAVTADGVELAGLCCRAPSGAGSDAASFVVAHGFTHDTSAPSTRRVISRLASYGPVVALDFRGHGRSGGRSSVGRDETADLDAAVGLVRPLTAGPVVVVGFSMGGAVALRHAAVGARPPDAVVSVSAPSRWYIRHTGPMRRVHWMLEHPVGPAVGRALGVRLGEPWATVPPTPLELMHLIAPRPLLLVHGDADPYFPTAEALSLHRAAGAHGELWIEPGMGHAETATSPALVDRIATWVRDQDITPPGCLPERNRPIGTERTEEVDAPR